MGLLCLWVGIRKRVRIQARRLGSVTVGSRPEEAGLKPARTQDGTRPEEAGLKPAPTQEGARPEEAGLKPAPTQDARTQDEAPTKVRRHGLSEVVRGFKTYSGRAG